MVCSQLTDEVSLRFPISVVCTDIKYKSSGGGDAHGQPVLRCSICVEFLLNDLIAAIAEHKDLSEQETAIGTAKLAAAFKLDTAASTPSLAPSLDQDSPKPPASREMQSSISCSESKVIPPLLSETVGKEEEAARPTAPADDCRIPSLSGRFNTQSLAVEKQAADAEEDELSAKVEQRESKVTNEALSAPNGCDVPCPSGWCNAPVLVDVEMAEFYQADLNAAADFTVVGKIEQHNSSNGSSTPCDASVAPLDAPPFPRLALRSLAAVGEDVTLSAGQSEQTSFSNGASVPLQSEDHARASGAALEAIKNCDIERLRKELAAGADACWVPPFDKRTTCLHQALIIGGNSNNSEESQWNHVIALLLAHAADVNTKDAEGSTPLHVCLMQPPLSLSTTRVRLLLNAAGDTNQRDNHGLSAIDYARRLCHQILERGGGARMGRCLAKVRAILHEFVERPTRAIHIANDRIVGVNFLDTEGTTLLMCTSMCLRVYSLGRHRLVSKRKFNSGKQFRVCAVAVDACTGVIAVCCEIVERTSACSMILVWKGGLENTDDPLKLFISLPALSAAGPALNISGYPSFPHPITLSASFKADSQMQEGQPEGIVLCWVLDSECQDVLRRYRFAAHAAVLSSDGQWIAVVSHRRVEVYCSEAYESVVREPRSSECSQLTQVDNEDGSGRRMTHQPGCLPYLCAADATDVAGVALERTSRVSGLLAVAFHTASSSSVPSYGGNVMNGSIVIWSVPHMETLAVLPRIAAVSNVRFWPLNPDLLVSAYVHGEVCLTDYTKEQQVAAYNETGTRCLDIACTSGCVASSSEDMLWISQLRPCS